jgi:hypothetical protein
VTSEVLVTSFGFDCDVGQRRLSCLILYLDVGGLPTPDAAGFASIMAGARERHGNDDNRLLDDMCIVLDSPHAAYLDPPYTSGEGPCA